MDRFTKEIEKRLDELIPKNVCAYKILFDAARYSVLSPAKRIRPSILLSIASAFGQVHEGALDVACALELIHTYSLIHDDLPSMDNDDIRRGKPTLHLAFGEANAILTGDFLLTHAFEVIANAKELTSEQKLHLIKVVSKRAGAIGMIGGQIMDIGLQEKEFSEQLLREMHHLKTASLFIAAFECGAIIGSAPKTNFSALSECGSYLGLAFQLIDDLEDQKENRINSISLCGEKKAKELVQKLLDFAKNHLSQVSVIIPYVEKLIKHLEI